MKRSCKNCELGMHKRLAKFTFTDIRHADPPKKKDVYVIRVSKKGKSPKTLMPSLKNTVEIINWDIVTKYITSRIDRIENIKDCDLIYVGSGGTSEKSKNNLKGRYSELASRHTAQFPLWLLLYLGWKLEYGWMATETPKIIEAELKEVYKKNHAGQLPALVHK